MGRLGRPGPPVLVQVRRGQLLLLLGVAWQGAVRALTSPATSAVGWHTLSSFAKVACCVLLWVGPACPRDVGVLE